jgi:hypothetical protein
MSGLTSSRGFEFDARRWTWHEVLTGSLTIFLLISLSLPWFNLRFLGCPPHRFSCLKSVIGPASGVHAHPYLWATVAPSLVIMFLLLLRAGLTQVTIFRWPTDLQLLTGAVCANLIIVAVAFIARPRYLPLPNPRHLPVQHLPPPVMAVSWEYGAFLALALACIAAASAAVNLVGQHQFVR